MFNHFAQILITRHRWSVGLGTSHKNLQYSPFLCNRQVIIYSRGANVVCGSECRKCQMGTALTRWGHMFDTRTRAYLSSPVSIGAKYQYRFEPYTVDFCYLSLSQNFIRSCRVSLIFEKCGYLTLQSYAEWSKRIFKTRKSIF